MITISTGSDDMPHQIIEYSANLEADLDIDTLVQTMHDTAVGLDALPIGGIRTRAARRDVFRVSDSHPDNTFINVTLRIAPRPPEIKKEVGEQLFNALRQFVQRVFDERPMALSLEIQEIDAEFRWKHSNIRDYLAQRNG
jgi:5-carboxymethyl-2-hydroxymuconate isomerase